MLFCVSIEPTICQELSSRGGKFLECWTFKNETDKLINTKLPQSKDLCWWNTERTSIAFKDCFKFNSRSSLPAEMLSDQIPQFGANTIEKFKKERSVFALGLFLFFTKSDLSKPYATMRLLHLAQLSRIVILISAPRCRFFQDKQALN